MVHRGAPEIELGARGFAPAMSCRFNVRRSRRKRLPEGSFGPSPIRIR
jgi:hypothetical protein